MSEPIKVGDLVVVVGAHCKGAEEWLGDIATVGGFVEPFPRGTCAYCRKDAPGVAAILMPRNKRMLLRYLKRIPPLSELDDVKQDQEIHA